MSVQISVIICSYNPREDYLRRVLDALERQTLAKDHWELLLIDNASAKPLNSKYDLNWHPNSRHVLEEELGLTPARLRGMREASAELLVFVDDDNVLADNYLEECFSISQEHTKIGCFGSSNISPDFEQKPSPELEKFVHILAIKTSNENSWSNNPRDGVIPWGAGLVVRKMVAWQYLKSVEKCPIRKNLDRKGKSLVSGGDDEFSWVACSIGQGKGIFHSLQITHLIDKKRVNLKYLLELTKAQSFSRCLLDQAHGMEIVQPVQPPTWRDCFGFLVRCKVATAIFQWNVCRAESKKTMVEKEFERAAREGVALAWAEKGGQKTARTGLN
jgi:glycosyltransferase involved in cell wall biosynthesis